MYQSERYCTGQKTPSYYQLAMRCFKVNGREILTYNWQSDGFKAYDVVLVNITLVFITGKWMVST